MLTRRILRIKAMQDIYAAYVQQKTHIKHSHLDKLRLLQESLAQDIEQIKHTHIQFLLLLLTWAAMDEEDDKDLLTFNKRLLKDNLWIKQLQNSGHFHDLSRRYGVSPLSQHIVQMCYYDGLRGHSAFKDYKNTQEENGKEDLMFIQKIVEKVAFANEALQGVIQQNFMEWNLYQTAFESFFLAFIRKFAKKKDEAFDPLHQKEAFLEPCSFYRHLTSMLLKEEATFDEQIKRETHNWALGRIFLLDRVLIKMGMAESYLSTPKAVIISEYVAIAKMYSTPQSHRFVHALLDKIIPKG